jgi:four helix bundle protein
MGNGKPGTGNRQPIQKGANIAERLLAFGLSALRIARELPRDAVTRHVALQLVRSATGAGANYEEARAAESRNDFVHKLGIAAKEVREATYWVQLIHGAGWVELSVLIDEANELSAILSASCRTARATE